MAEECLTPDDVPTGAGGPGAPDTSNTVDVEFLCDETTDTWFQVVFIGGVEQSRTDTNTPCSEPPPVQAQIDVETVCIAGTIHHLVFTDGVQTSDTDTGQQCSSTDVNYTTVVECRNGTQTSVTRAISEGGLVTELSATDLGVACCPQADTRYEHRCMVDDIDGIPANWVRYVEYLLVEVDCDGNITETSRGTFTDDTNTTAYNPVGVQQLTCCDAAQLGDVAATLAAAGETYGQGVITPNAEGSSWIDSLTVTAVGGDVEFTDQFGNTSFVRQGQSKTWTSHYPLPLTAPTFTIPAGVELDVHWVQPTF